MSLHTQTAEVLENQKLCIRVIEALERQYPRRFIQRNYGVTRRQLERIVEYHDNGKLSSNPATDFTN